jgi:hypothetical protein
MSELLPTTYYHLVFTLPQELRSVIMGNRILLFNLLFAAGHHCINTLGADKKWLGAKPGIVSLLHTNGQDLSFHPCLCRQAGAYSLHCKWRWYRCSQQVGKGEKSQWQLPVSKNKNGAGVQRVFFKEAAKTTAAAKGKNA